MNMLVAWVKVLDVVSEKNIDLWKNLPKNLINFFE